MTVEKPVPCALYDIPGIQEWLDEMALQGLFLKSFNRHFDRATFELDDPKPVRYRLDPVSKNRKKDLEREEPYAQMGWTFVTHISKYYYVFSCSDPQAPELYSDPQSLSLALGDIMKREVRNTVLLSLVPFLLIALLFLLDRRGAIKKLLLWEDPQYLMTCVLYPILILLVLVPLLILSTRKRLKIRATLAQGLPLKPKRRWDRPRYYTWYFPTYLAIFILPRLLVPSIGWETWDLEEAPLSRTWPTIAQLEADAPWAGEAQLLRHGYATTNSSWPAPVQEYSSTDWEVRSPDVGPSGDRWTGVRYVQARSPKIAELIFGIERTEADQTLERWTEWTSSANHIEGDASFTSWDWPGVDRLEVAQYRQRDQDGWTFAALRGRDVLVVQYIGSAPPEDCIDLYLEALDW